MRNLLRALASLVPARFKGGPSMPEVYRFDALDAEHLPYHERLSAFTAIGNWVVTLGKATLLPNPVIPILPTLNAIWYRLHIQNVRRHAWTRRNTGPSKSSCNERAVYRVARTARSTV